MNNHLIVDFIKITEINLQFYTFQQYNWITENRLIELFVSRSLQYVQYTSYIASRATDIGIKDQSYCTDIVRGKYPFSVTNYKTSMCPFHAIQSSLHGLTPTETHIYLTYFLRATIATDQEQLEILKYLNILRPDDAYMRHWSGS